MSEEKYEIPEGVKIQMGEWKEFSKAVEEDRKKLLEKENEELDISSPEFLRQA